VLRVKEINGLPVVDAKKNITLVISPEQVQRANVKKPDSCAIAQSCLALKGVKEARIHLSRAYIRTNDHNWQRFVVPAAARSEIVAFDRGGKFSPGEYTLSAPPPSYKLGADARRGRKTGPKKTKRKKYHVITDVRMGPA